MQQAARARLITDRDELCRGSLRTLASFSRVTLQTAQQPKMLRPYCKMFY